MKKIKLRDMTKEQLEKYCSEVCPHSLCEDCVFAAINCDLNDEYCWIYNKDLYSDKLLDQEIEVEDEPILTEEEINYLSAVIKPFRDRLTHLRKTDNFVGDKGFEYLLFFGKRLMMFDLPHFEKGKYYKGMEINRKYTLEELGL